MNASELVEKLLANGQLISLLASDPYGNPAIYQILSPEAEVFPRLALFEAMREYTLFADDIPIEERVQFRVDIYARDNVLYPINAALHAALRAEGLHRVSEVQDAYIEEVDVYVKSTTYEITVLLPTPWD